MGQQCSQAGKVGIILKLTKVKAAQGGVHESYSKHRTWSLTQGQQIGWVAFKVVAVQEGVDPGALGGELAHLPLDHLVLWPRL